MHTHAHTHTHTQRSEQVTHIFTGVLVRMEEDVGISIVELAIVVLGPVLHLYHATGDTARQ